MTFPRETAGSSTVRVLLVEGSAADSTSIRMNLAAEDSANWHVIHAPYFRQAIRELRDQSPDVIFLHLDGELGRRPLSQQREQAREVPSFAITEAELPETILWFIDGGAHGHIVRGRGDRAQGNGTSPGPRAPLASLRAAPAPAKRLPLKARGP